MECRELALKKVVDITTMRHANATKRNEIKTMRQHAARQHDNLPVVFSSDLCRVHWVGGLRPNRLLVAKLSNQHPCKKPTKNESTEIIV